MMNEKLYNQFFRNFFLKIDKEYSIAKNKDEKEIIFDLLVDTVERNKQFLMQYPLVTYWEQTKEENKILEFYKGYDNSKINLYFHIPFCEKKCSYCNFNIFLWGKFQEEYINNLEEEIKYFLSIMKNIEIETLFIGGWTPSFLSEINLDKLLNIIDSNFSSYYLKNYEYTFEWNPESFNKEKLQILKKYWVNRITFWVQSFDNAVLEKANRSHNLKIVKDIIEEIKKQNFTDISIDMLYGLNLQTEEVIKSDIEKLLQLKVNHINYYALFYFKNSLLDKTVKKEERNYKKLFNFYELIQKKLKENWYKQYWREYFTLNKKHKYQENYIKSKKTLWFWNSSYSFNWKVSFIKEESIKKYLIWEKILKYFIYTKEELIKRKFVLWIQNKFILREKEDCFLKKEIEIAENFWLIKKNEKNFTLTKKWIKYEHILGHLFL